MAINVLTGLQGSGKSYESVKSIILPALSKGRRVVTNVAGLNEARCHDYLVGQGFERDKLGRVVHFTNERLKEPGFFPGEVAAEFKFIPPDWVPLRELKYFADAWAVREGKTFGLTAWGVLLPDLARCREVGLDIGSVLVEATQKEWKAFDLRAFSGRPRDGSSWCQLEEPGPTVVQPGDLVVVDECWLFWSDAQKLDPEHMNFFRMHRHYVSGDGQPCDMVLMIQDFQSLNRFLRGVCQVVMHFTKLSMLGLSSRYRAVSYEGKPSAKTRISVSPLCRYESKYFPLYKSYDGASGKETVVDDRGNLFKNRWFVFVMVGAVAGLGWAGMWFVQYVSRLRAGGATEANAAPAAPSASKPGSVGPSLEPTKVVTASSSAEARFVGFVVQRDGVTLGLFQLGDGRIVRQRVEGGVLDGWSSIAARGGRMHEISGQAGKK